MLKHTTTLVYDGHSMASKDFDKKSERTWEKIGSLTVDEITLLLARLLKEVSKFAYQTLKKKGYTVEGCLRGHDCKGSRPDARVPTLGKTRGPIADIGGCMGITNQYVVRYQEC